MRDGDRCINCKAPVRNDEIRHLKGCPDYVKERTKDVRPR